MLSAFSRCIQVKVPEGSRRKAQAGPDILLCGAVRLARLW